MGRQVGEDSMSWNYRMLAEVVGELTMYWVGEVYYDKNGKPDSWSGREFNVIADWDDLDDLKGTIEKVAKAVHEPVLQIVGNKLVEWS